MPPVRCMAARCRRGPALGRASMEALLADARVHSPHIAQRGIKFNLPLDLRTPATRRQRHARANIPKCGAATSGPRSSTRWRHRYNVLSLWSLNPFPSMVRVPEFPTWRSTMCGAARQARPVPLDGTGKNNVLRLPRGSRGREEDHIDEKIAFWRDVMQLAADRGVSIYISPGTCFPTARSRNTASRPTCRTAPPSPTIARVRELVKTYPLLAGIASPPGKTWRIRIPTSQRAVALATYGEGVRDALKDSPAAP